ncbi:MAG TPA: transglutaminase domain-containing protein [Methanosarcina sp.]|nr:transglutaminase domain-containing protein [Methanosarcina sp.]
MVGNSMRKSSIVLLAAFIAAVAVCACESLDAGNFEMDQKTNLTTGFHDIVGSNVIFDAAIAGNIIPYCSFSSNRLSGSECFNLMDLIKNASYNIENLNLKFGLPEVNIMQNRQPVIQDNQPVFRKGSPMRPAQVKEEPVRRGIPDRNELNSFEEKIPVQYENIISNYQAYVTPDSEAVKFYLEENGLDNKYEIYEAATSWTWVSDETLNDKEEKWLTPAEFLNETAIYSSNPVYGEPASDCEEQANTLASLLIASEEYNESTVRVAIGKVDFGEVSGGHAWVEVYEDGEWFPLDPTDGPYYDDNTSKLVAADSSDIDYDQYRNGAYPAVEIWYYYNNEYFIDLGTYLGNAPVSWNKKPVSYQKKLPGRS